MSATIETFAGTYLGGGGICPTCREVCGSLQIGGSLHVQRCKCQAEDVSGIWGRLDFPRLIEICYCCGATLIRSGSRWSSFFCRTCRPRVCALDEDVGFPLIPVGPHSAMHGWLLHGDAPAAEIRTFASAVISLFERVELLYEWRRQTVERNLQALALPDSGEVALTEYLREAGTLDRRLAFVQLRRRFLEELD